MLDLSFLPGLVSFPSFHTAAGVIIVASFWRTAFLLPALLFSAAMIAGTPIFGGHYFVDMLSGAAIACAMLVAFALLPYYRGMFGRTAANGSWVRLPPSGRPAAAGTIEA
jgi:membrane-associated phospholipid phosphatase